MSEILVHVHYDFNGGFIVEHHYMPNAPKGRGQTVQSAIEDFIKRNYDHCKGRVMLRTESFLLMDDLSKKQVHADDLAKGGYKLSRERLIELEDWANELPDEAWITHTRCKCCGNIVYSDKRELL